VIRIIFFSCCWKATPTLAFNEFFTNFYEFFNFGKFVKIREYFFCWGNEFSIYAQDPLKKAANALNIHPSPSFSSSPLLFQLEGMGSAVSSPSGIWQWNQPKSILVHFSFKIWHMVATILIIFLWESTAQISSLPQATAWSDFNNKYTIWHLINFNDTQFV